MKRLMLVLLTVLLSLSLTGCKKDEPEPKAELKVEISLKETYSSNETINVEVNYQNLRQDSKAWIAIIPLTIEGSDPTKNKEGLQWMYLIDITKGEVDFKNPGEGEWLVVVLADDDGGSPITKKSFKVSSEVVEDPTDPTDDQKEEPIDEEPHTINLETDATKLIAYFEDSIYVFYYSGNKITGIENYYAFSDSITAKESVAFIREANAQDPEVEEVYAKENYVVVKYLPISYAELTRCDVLNIYSIDVSNVDYKSFFAELYGEDLIEFTIDFSEGSSQTYYCKDGMTIFDFIESAGNIDGFYQEDDVVYDYFGVEKIDYQDDGFIYAITPKEKFTMSLVQQE